MDLNRHLIWNFCKRFSLNQPLARITEPAGETLRLCMAPKGEDEFPDITVEATATAISGTIVKMDFYDGETLIGSLTDAPYQATLMAPKTGKHDLRVVATDEMGKTGSKVAKYFKKECLKRKK